MRLLIVIGTFRILLRNHLLSFVFGNRSGRSWSDGWRWNMTLLSGVHNEAHFGLLSSGVKFRSLGQGCDAVGHEVRRSGIVHFFVLQTTDGVRQPAVQSRRIGYARLVVAQIANSVYNLAKILLFAALCLNASCC